MTTGYVSEKRKTNLMAISNYTTATEQIKEAILSSQYTAAKQVNAVQLSLYEADRSWMPIRQLRLAN